jgi:hypothetical protein
MRSGGMTATRDDEGSQSSTPVPMETLAGQLFRLGKAARGADVDALEIYRPSAPKARLTLDGAGIPHLLKPGISLARLIRAGL